MEFEQRQLTRSSWPVKSWPVKSWPVKSWPVQSGPVLSWPMPSWPVLFVGVFVAYVAGSLISFHFLVLAELGAAFFPPAGLLMAILALCSRRRWPVVLLAGALAENTVDFWKADYHWWEQAGYTTANLAGATVGAILLLILAGGRVPDLARRSGLGLFALSAAAGTAVSACIGAITVAAAGPEHLLITFVQWWLGDGLGVILVGSVILARVSSPDRRTLRSIEGAAFLILTPSAVAALYWFTKLPINFIILIAILPVATRYGTQAVSILALLVAGVALSLVTANELHLDNTAEATALVLFKLQVGAFTLAALYVAAESFEREQAVAAAADEHETIGYLQRALLPARLISGQEFLAHGVYEAASQRTGVGGDWYDVMELPDGRVFVCVGDVVGHGTSAVVAMGQLRFAIGAIAGLDLTPGQVLDRMDQAAARIDGGLYTTVWAGCFDPRSGELAYSSAGHPPALICWPDGTSRWLDGARWVPLGLATDQLRPTATVEFDGPATVVVFTDGTVERPGESLDVGFARLVGTLSGAGPAPWSQLEDVLAMVKDPSGRDDSVLLAVELSPSRPAVRAVAHAELVDGPA